MMMTMMVMQAFPRPPPPAVVACRCCCKLVIADYTLTSLDYQNLQGLRKTSEVDFCSDEEHGGQNCIGRMRRETLKGSTSPVSSGPVDKIRLRTGGDTMNATRAVRNSPTMDCHDHQEEGASTSSVCGSSILDCNSSSAAADVLCNDLNKGSRGNDVNAGTNTALMRSQNCNSSTSSSSASALEIECFNEADISAACLLLEMSTSTASHSADDAAAELEDCSQKQPRSIIRVSDRHNHAAAAAPSLPPVRELSELMGRARSSAGCARTTDDDVGGTELQERKATWEGEATYSSSSTPRSLRIELRTLGKKRIKPRKDERELVFGMNQELSTSDNKFEILDRPTRKRHYKSLRELLGVK